MKELHLFLREITVLGPFSWLSWYLEKGSEQEELKKHQMESHPEDFLVYLDLGTHISSGVARVEKWLQHRENEGL